MRLFKILFLTFLLFTTSFASDTNPNIQLYGVFTLLPPLVAIVLAYITRNVILSLFIGVFSGTFLLSLSKNVILTDKVSGSGIFNTATESFSSIVHHVLDSMADSGNAGIILQIFCIGGVVALVTKMGGINAIAKTITKYVKGPVSAQVNTWLVGLCIFFDDYANSLTVGPIMRPVTDKFKVSREKLSFILDSTAAPVAGIAIISTWIGLEVSLINDAYQAAYKGTNVEVNAFGIFMETIPYRFYNIFMLMFVVLTAVMQREFGPMYAAEVRARKGLPSLAATDIGSELEPELKPNDNIEQKISNALIPILTLIIFSFIGFYFSGLSELKDEALLNAQQNPISFETLRATFGAADSSIVLFQSALFATIVAILLGVSRKVITFSQAIDTWLHGWKSMIFTIAMLLLAWSLASIVKELGTPDYLVSLLADNTPKNLLPSIIFLLGSAISFAIGTSYGTMGILMPLAVPLAHAVGANYGLVGAELHEYTVISIACVLTGAIFGNHCSPIADTVILSAMSAKCDITEHVKTQYPYAFVVCGVSVLFGYIPATFGMNEVLTLLLGLFAMVVILRIVGKKVEA